MAAGAEQQGNDVTIPGRDPNDRTGCGSCEKPGAWRLTACFPFGPLRKRRSHLKEAKLSVRSFGNIAVMMAVVDSPWLLHVAILVILIVNIS